MYFSFLHKANSYWEDFLIIWPCMYIAGNAGQPLERMNQTEHYYLCKNQINYSIQLLCCNLEDCERVCEFVTSEHMNKMLWEWVHRYAQTPSNFSHGWVKTSYTAKQKEIMNLLKFRGDISKQNIPSYSGIKGWNLTSYSNKTALKMSSATCWL